MADHYNKYHLKHLARTIAECMDLPLPDCYAPSVGWAVSILKERLGGGAVPPCLLVFGWDIDRLPVYIVLDSFDQFLGQHLVCLDIAHTGPPITIGTV